MKYHNMGSSFIEIIFIENILVKLIYNIIIYYNSIKKMSSFPPPIESLTLRVTTSVYPNAQPFEQTISSANMGSNSIPIHNTSLTSAFNTQPPGTIFNASIVATYAPDSFATGDVLSIPNVLNFVPRKITPTLSLGGIPNTVTSTDDPFSLTVTSASNGVLTYSSSVPGVATINSSGLVTPVSAGTTTITVNQAASADGVYVAATASIELVVSVPLPLTLAYFNFDSNGNDASTNNNHLTNHNTVTFDTVNFKRGTGAALFNGSNYFEIANDGRFSPDNFTVACWIKPKSNSVHQAIASCRNNNSVTAGWMIYILPGNMLQFLTGNGSSSFSGPSIVYSSFGTFIDTWVHIAITLNKSSGACLLYVNGTLTSTATVNYVNNTGTNMRIGAGANESSPEFFLKNGTLLDDFQIYNSVLSASEISSIYAE